MKQFAKVVLLVLGFGLLTLALSTTTSRPAAASGSAPVVVTNTPLPIQGAVNAAQSGIWNVGINGTPSVNVANTLTVADAVQPFFGRLCYGCFPAYPPVNVPSGKLFIIEFVSGRCVVEGGATVGSELNDVVLETPQGGASNRIVPYMEDHVAAPNKHAEFSWSQQTRIYADSSGALSLSTAGSVPSDGLLVCFASVNGRLVPAQ